MAQPPFWLDDVFSGSPDSFQESLLKAKRFQAAILKAKGAALEAQQREEDNGPIPGQLCSNQAARIAFLESMELMTPYECEGMRSA